MKAIELDAARWGKILDFYDNLAVALGAPKWCGYSPDALVDSMIWGGMNAIDPPYRIVVRNIGDAPSEVVEHIKLVQNALAEGRAYFKANNDHDVIVDFEILS